MFEAILGIEVMASHMLTCVLLMTNMPNLFVLLILGHMILAKLSWIDLNSSVTQVGFELIILLLQPST